MYRLPIVSKEVDDKVENGFRATPEYGNLLLKRYSRINPLILRPLEKIPAESRPYATFSILSSVKKLETQAKSEGSMLPIVTEDTVQKVDSEFALFTQDDMSRSAMRFFNGNRIMFRSATTSMTKIPKPYRRDVLYSTMLALGYLMEQGKIDDLENQTL